MRELAIGAVLELLYQWEWPRHYDWYGHVITRRRWFMQTQPRIDIAKATCTCNERSDDIR